VKLTKLGWAAVLVFLLFFVHPRSLWLNNLGLLFMSAGLALRIWAAGHAPENGKGPYAATPRPLQLGMVMIAFGFTLICTSLRHWFSTLFLWTVFASIMLALFPAGLPRPGGFDKAWESSAFSWDLALKSGEKKTLYAVLTAAFYLRFRMVYTW
jgi:hypothetical protein